MPKYYNTITKEIVDYPSDAAALFDVLKPVPSTDAKRKDEASTTDKNETVKPNAK